MNANMSGRMNDLATELAAHFTTAQQKAQRYDLLQAGLNEACDGMFKLIALMDGPQIERLEEAIRIRRGQFDGGLPDAKLNDHD